jgi:Zn-dependent M16 (insulinase) family peptidase
MNTANYSYKDLNQALNINTGSFWVNLKTYLEQQDDNKLIAKLIVNSKVMTDKLDPFFSLSNDILNHTLFTDTARLNILLMRHLSQLEANVNQDGYTVAHSRLTSYFNKKGMFDELTGGLDYYWFVSGIVKDFKQKQSSVTTNLQKVTELLINRNNLVSTVTCSKDDFEKFSAAYSTFVAQLPDKKAETISWTFTPETKNEGLLAPSKVQYVMAGYNYKTLGFGWSGTMRVLSQVLSTDWLQNQVRIIGGAYGGWAEISPNGTLIFNSYRDPNLKQTIDSYRKTVNYLETFNADEKTMTRYIIGTIAAIDVPLTPSQKGELAFSWYFGKRTLQEIQHNRDEILATRASDLRGFARLISEVLNKDAVCVYGNPEKLKADRGLFKSLVVIDK